MAHKSNPSGHPYEVAVHDENQPEDQDNDAILVDIDNPLVRLSPAELVADVESFATVNNLTNILDLLIRGAKVARDPEAYESVLGLTAEEKAALKREKQLGFWRQTKELRTTILTCAIAAILQGWDQSSMNGANLHWPRDLGLHVGASTGDSLSIKKDIWVFAFINAAPFLFAALIGAWLSDPLNEYVYGRRAAIFISALFCFFSVIGSACTHTWQQLLACRVLLGIGMGAKASVVPVYAAEVSPAHIRGSLVMSWQLFVAFGIFLGFSANLVVFNIKSLAWRLQLAAASLPAIPLIFLIFVCPESPRFLIKKGRFKEAYTSLCYLNETPLQAARELYYISAQIEAENQLYMNKDSRRKDLELQDIIPGDNGNVRGELLGRSAIISNTSFWRRLWRLGSVPRIRRALLAAFVVMVAQQLCGVNIIAFYSSSVFSNPNNEDLTPEQVTSDHKRALWLGWGFGLTNFLFAWPAYGAIDRRGRRALLLFTIPGLALTLLAAGFSFQIPVNSKAYIGVITFFIILFSVFYSPGLGPVPFTYSAEVFPLVNREVGMSFAVFWNLLGAGILSLIVPVLNDALKATGLMCLFAGLNVVAFILVFLFVYETKEATLEELNSIFSVRTRRHIEYQVKYVLPWPWKYYIRKTVKTRLDPPYRWRHGTL
ncbi:hypothetical protein H2201_004922 [Coniosporium apollinis]|uniref:Major facilitator superfamily (MFS) profile domain-containing protein n=1 Tax=Coniosporium apollinis TaxID=61459 RepID=A0ABQ9NRQ2_9PEZI|nr:hypothetical protein H2201_004922 [Coniosporium apollinis]